MIYFIYLDIDTTQYYNNSRKVYLNYIPIYAGPKISMFVIVSWTLL